MFHHVSVHTEKHLSGVGDHKWFCNVDRTIDLDVRACAHVHTSVQTSRRIQICTAACSLTYPLNLQKLDHTLNETTAGHRLMHEEVSSKNNMQIAKSKVANPVLLHEGLCTQQVC